MNSFKVMKQFNEGSQVIKNRDFRGSARPLKRKRLRNWIIGLTIMIMLIIGVASSYSGFTKAKSACIKNNGTITEESIDLLAFNWSVSCERPSLVSN